MLVAAAEYSNCKSVPCEKKRLKTVFHLYALYLLGLDAISVAARLLNRACQPRAGHFFGARAAWLQSQPSDIDDPGTGTPMNPLPARALSLRLPTLIAAGSFFLAAR